MHPPNAIVVALGLAVLASLMPPSPAHGVVLCRRKAKVFARDTFCRANETLIVLPTGPKGPEGEQGPEGPEGPPGAPGESGASEVFATFVQGPVAIAKDEFTVVATLSLPPGAAYTATASLNIVSNLPGGVPDRVTCELSLNLANGGRSTSGEVRLGSPSVAGANSHASMALVVASEDAETARIGCIRSGDGPANANGVHIVVTRVASVTQP